MPLSSVTETARGYRQQRLDRAGWIARFRSQTVALRSEERWCLSTGSPCPLSMSPSTSRRPGRQPGAGDIAAAEGG
ncbi:hypothetical protein Dda_2629 [Drechslerella dactyloides]|uniref:Uncharacterized protein n=1 Tax=Drechslerella dactyloides TaxID=74499 RepID=A0AAD6IZX9_DREDA|nr:hypothetical protein Dda_2629 [Drechslerella dactyloides]